MEQKAKIGSPIFILREEATRDLAGVLEKLRDIGYEGVELLGLFGRSAKEVRGIADSLRFPVMGDHVPLDALENAPDEIFFDREAIGCKYITIGFPRALMSGVREAEAIDRIGECARRILAAGFVPLYHNHNFDVSFMEKLADSCRDVSLEPDLGWMLFAGGDPARFLKKYADRCPVIHLKDIYVDDLTKLGANASVEGAREFEPSLGGFAFRPTGYGILNIPSLWSLCAACNPEWFVMDHDSAYDRDVYEDMRLGYEFLRALIDLHPFQ